MRRKNNWSILVPTILSILAIVVALFDDDIKNFRLAWYARHGKDIPDIAIEEVSLDQMDESTPFYCGYYVSLSEAGMVLRAGRTFQQNIEYSPYHEVRFTLRNRNKLTQGTAVIRDVQLAASGFFENRKEPERQGEDCGAGETEKIYTISEEDVARNIDEGTPFVISASVAPENVSEFDFTTLPSDEPVEYYKLKIPMPKYGVLEFQVRVIVRYRGVDYLVNTRNLYIANDEPRDREYKEINSRIEEEIRRYQEYIRNKKLPGS